MRQSAACLGLGGVGEYIGGGDREKREKGERDRSGGINAHGKRRGMVKVGGGGVGKGKSECVKGRWEEWGKVEGCMGEANVDRSQVVNYEHGKNA